MDYTSYKHMTFERRDAFVALAQRLALVGLIDKR